jgi:hypothetical protein
MKFDPDRDRTATRQDMVDVLFTIQRIIGRGGLAASGRIGIPNQWRA